MRKNWAGQVAWVIAALFAGWLLEKTMPNPSGTEIYLAWGGVAVFTLLAMWWTWPRKAEQMTDESNLPRRHTVGIYLGEKSKGGGAVGNIVEGADVGIEDHGDDNVIAHNFIGLAKTRPDHEKPPKKYFSGWSPPDKGDNP